MPSTPHRKKPQRRSIRLPEWDYTAPGAYFITLCTHQRENLFGHAPFRELAENAWRNMPCQPHARQVTLDEWVVMPNHIHAILWLGEQTGERAGRLETHSPKPRLRPGSVGAIVGNYKALVTRRINVLRGTPGGSVWQRGYYERIARNDRELDAIRRYIRDNPAQWVEDRDNLEAHIGKMRYCG
jgi:putative transposase